jgi:GT2 family glycosyltransferase
VLRLSVIIPATAGGSTLDRCVAALERATRAGDEILPVTSAPAPGVAAARNAGAAQARGEVLVFVDVDVIVEPEALTLLRSHLEADPSLTAVFGSYDDTPEAPDLVSQFRNLLHHHVHHESPGIASTYWGGLGGVRREAFAAVGGFDSRRDGLEDVDFGMRIIARGARVLLDPRIRGKHLKHWSLANMLSTDFRLRGVQWIALMLRMRTSSPALNFGWRHRLSALAALGTAGALLARRPRPLVAALAAMGALNASFYALLLRRLGPRGVAGGLVLHVLHHLVAVAAVPAGVLEHLRETRAERRG